MRNARRCWCNPITRAWQARTALTAAQPAGAQIHEEVQASEPQPQSQPSQQAAREDDDLSGSNGPQDADPSQPDTMGIGEMSFDESISPWESVDGLVDDASDVSVLPGTRQQEAVAAGASLAQAVGSEAAEQRVRMLAAGVSLAHPGAALGCWDWQVHVWVQVWVSM